MHPLSTSTAAAASTSKTSLKTSTSLTCRSPDDASCVTLSATLQRPPRRLRQLGLSLFAVLATSGSSLRWGGSWLHSLDLLLHWDVVASPAEESFPVRHTVTLRVDACDDAPGNRKSKQMGRYKNCTLELFSSGRWRRLDRPKQKVVVFVLKPKTIFWLVANLINNLQSNFTTLEWHYRQIYSQYDSGVINYDCSL